VHEHAPDYTIPKNLHCAGDGSIQTLPRFQRRISVSASATLPPSLATDWLRPPCKDGGYRSDAQLGTVLDREGLGDLSELLKKP
jgi:hypothetical protein